MHEYLIYIISTPVPLPTPPKIPIPSKFMTSSMIITYLCTYVYKYAEYNLLNPFSAAHMNIWLRLITWV